MDKFVNFIWKFLAVMVVITSLIAILLLLSGCGVNAGCVTDRYGREWCGSVEKPKKPVEIERKVILPQTGGKN